MSKELLLVVLCVGLVGAQDEPPTVDELLIPQYIGRWYQVSSVAFEKGKGQAEQNRNRTIEPVRWCWLVSRMRKR